MNINTKQKRQLIVGGLSIILLIAWLFFPGWRASKILGIISMALLATSNIILSVKRRSVDNKVVFRQNGFEKGTSGRPFSKVSKRYYQ